VWGARSMRRVRCDRARCGARRRWYVPPGPTPLPPSHSQHDDGDEAELHERSTSTTLWIHTARMDVHAELESACVLPPLRRRPPAVLCPRRATRPPGRHHHRGPTNPACSSTLIIYLALCASNHKPSPTFSVRSSPTIRARSTLRFGMDGLMTWQC
jgi:hypothetical protein